MCSTATIFNRGEDRGSLKTLVNLASFCQNLGFKDYSSNWRTDIRGRKFMCLCRMSMTGSAPDQSGLQGIEPSAVALARAVSSERMANLRRENARLSESMTSAGYRLFVGLRPLTLANADARASAVLIDELDACLLECGLNFLSG
jgi:hypothetical protein